MSVKALAVGVAALLSAGRLAAQERGTMEFGAFGSAASFDNALSLKTGYGGGGRIGMYLDPRLSIEFEDAEMRATRPNGLRDVNVGILSGRLVATPFTSGRLSLLAGVGAGVSTETNFLHSYGVDVLLGLKMAVRENAAIRIDGVYDWLANEDWKSYRSVRVGLSLYRRPARVIREVTVTLPAPAPMMRDDSVSAAETRRLRERDAALRALRDSLANAPVRASTVPSDAQIQFDFDRAEITPSARRVLDDHVAMLRANPTQSILIVGYTDVKGSDSYNMSLGERRARATRDYLVAQGFAADRIMIESRGEREQIAPSRGAAGEAENRRANFRIRIAPESRP